MTKLGGGGGKRSVTGRDLGHARDDGLTDRVWMTGGGCLTTPGVQEEVAGAKIGCYVSQARCQRWNEVELEPYGMANIGYASNEFKMGLDAGGTVGLGRAGSGSDGRVSGGLMEDKRRTAVGTQVLSRVVVRSLSCSPVRPFAHRIARFALKRVARSLALHIRISA